jgi:putative endonuclease
MSLLARVIFGIVDFKARRGLAESVPSSAANPSQTASGNAEAKTKARLTGIRGETYAYWYLRRLGYVMVAKNYMAPGLKGEIDLVGYDGPVLAFIEVKTRTASDKALATPEDAVTEEKRRNLDRMARRFASERHTEAGEYRFDVVAIETSAGRKPEVRLHKGAFCGTRR